MNIRRAEPTEAERLSEIALAAKGYWGYAEELMALWRSGLIMTTQRIIEDTVYLAACGHDIVGFYSLTPTADAQIYELDDLWIDPPWIGQGVGKQLFQHALAQAKTCGAMRLQLAADPQAVGFYAKMGMTKIGRRQMNPIQTKKVIN